MDIQTFDNTGSAVTIPEDIYSDWSYAVVNGLVDYYRLEC